MEETDQKKTLRMKYSRKSIGFPDFQNQEDISSTCEEITDARKCTIEKSTLQTEELKRTSMTTSKQEADETSPEELQKLTQNIEELNFKLKQENSEKSENQTQIANLQKKLDNREKIIEEQKHKLDELKKVLEARTAENEKLNIDLNLATDSMNQKEEKLTLLKVTIMDKTCSFEEFCEAVCSLKREHSQLTVAFHEENARSADKTEEISSLEKRLADEQKIAKELENFLSEETAKNKQLEEELRFLINKTNEEKGDLQEKFEEFKRATCLFLENCNKHREVILEAVNKEPENVF